MVGVHGGAHAGGVRLALVATRPPFRFFRNKLVVDSPTVYTNGQVVKYGVLSLSATVFAHIIGMGPNFKFRFGPRPTQFKIRPDLVQFTHFELKLSVGAPPWPGKNLFFL
jgi:hypothetical protein